MFKYISQFLFTFFIIAIFIAEGLGFLHGHEAVILLGGIFLLPIFYFSNYRQIKIPKKIGIILGSLIAIGVVSTIFSVNVERSLENLLSSVSVSLILIYSFNNKKNLAKRVLFIIDFVSIFLCLAAFFIFISQNHRLFTFIPSSGFNLISTTSYFHNMLGDFLVLPLSISLYALIRKKFIKRNILFLLIFLPFFVLSFSRVAYLAIILFILSQYLTRSISKLGKVCTLAVIFICVGFFVLITKNSGVIPYVSTIQKSSHLDKIATTKPITANRLEYLRESVLSIAENPIIGIGQGNFMYASIRHTTDQSLWTQSSHNLLLDIFVEQGVFGFVVFSLFLIVVIKSGFKHFAARTDEEKIIFYLFLLLFFIFQTYFLFDVYSIYVIFFTLSGLFYEEEQKILSYRPIITSAILLFIICLTVLTSKVFYTRGDYEKSLMFYPLNRDAYIKLLPMLEKQGRYKDASILIMRSKIYFRADIETELMAARFYQTYGDRKRLLTTLKIIYHWYPHYIFK